MSLTYAIADLHGRFELLERAYKAIRKHSEGGKIVHLGDYVDRGPQSRQIIEFLMDEKTIPEGFSRIVLKGNHEDIMVQALRNSEKMGWWVINGGGQTLKSYSGEVDLAHIRWLDELPLYHEDANRVFVHAWVHPTKPLSGQVKLKCHHGQLAMIWELYRASEVGGHNGKHVVHGHEQFERGPICLSERTDLDTFAWYTGRLVVGVFDDEKPGGPVDFIEVKGKTAMQLREADLWRVAQW